MSLLNHIKKSLNVGGIKMFIALDDEVHSQGDRVRGRLVLRAGEYEVTAKSVQLNLREYWTELNYDGENYLNETIAQVRLSRTLGPATVRPDADTTLEFDFLLPADARWTTSGTGWDLYVHVDVDNAIDPTGSLTLMVVPGRQVAAIVDALEDELRFEERPRKRRWGNGWSAFRFRPPHALKSELDALVAELRQRDDGGVDGRLVFDLQEQTVSDYFRAIAGRDLVQTTIDLPFDAIVDNHGSPSPQLKHTLGEHLRAVLERSD